MQTKRFRAEVKNWDKGLSADKLRRGTSVLRFQEAIILSFIIHNSSKLVVLVFFFFFFQVTVISWAVGLR